MEAEHSCCYVKVYAKTILDNSSLRQRKWLLELRLMVARFALTSLSLSALIHRLLAFISANLPPLEVVCVHDDQGLRTAVENAVTTGDILAHTRGHIPGHLDATEKCENENFVHHAPQMDNRRLSD